MLSLYSHDSVSRASSAGRGRIVCHLDRRSHERHILSPAAPFKFLSVLFVSVCACPCLIGAYYSTLFAKFKHVFQSDSGLKCISTNQTELKTTPPTPPPPFPLCMCYTVGLHQGNKIYDARFVGVTACSELCTHKARETEEIELYAAQHKRSRGCRM
jgi:hypothetical protein